ncbi:MAG: DUF2237 domain-containing protein [Candidatus Obscuribacterales bacterium]|nr:DUF2237 domain-containing protein [Candidatus Obscuribacterales bacterium]
MASKKNVLGTELQVCCLDPITGFHRNGYCEMEGSDVGAHILCARVTKEFLEYSRAQGNDLSTANAEYGFPGLKPGDQWCLCASRWQQALEAGCAPPVVLEATHEYTLEYTSLKDLKEHAWKPEKAE